MSKALTELCVSPLEIELRLNWFLLQLNRASPFVRFFSVCMKQRAPRTMEFSIHDFATTLSKLYDTCVRIDKLIRSPVHSGGGNVCSSRGDSIFSVLPTFKATTKPEKCHLFSGPCSGTENSKSSALFIRLRSRRRRRARMPRSRPGCFHFRTPGL